MAQRSVLPPWLVAKMDCRHRLHYLRRRLFCFRTSAVHVSDLDHYGGLWLLLCADTARAESIDRGNGWTRSTRTSAGRIFLRNQRGHARSQPDHRRVVEALRGGLALLCFGGDCVRVCRTVDVRRRGCWTTASR